MFGDITYDFKFTKEAGNRSDSSDSESDNSDSSYSGSDGLSGSGNFMG